MARLLFPQALEIVQFLGHQYSTNYRECIFIDQAARGLIVNIGNCLQVWHKRNHKHPALLGFLLLHSYNVVSLPRSTVRRSKKVDRC